MVKVATLPYYRLYQFNTIRPLEFIAKFASESQPDEAKIAQAIATWRARKLAELHFITIAVSSDSFWSEVALRLAQVYRSCSSCHWFLLLDHHRRSLLAHTRVLAQ